MEKINYRVLFVNGTNNIAGQELSLVSRIKGLKKLGIYSDVILSEEGILSNWFKKNDIHIRIIKLNRLSKKKSFTIFDNCN